MSGEGNGSRWDRFTPNWIDRERFAPVAKNYVTTYAVRRCSRCGERRATKGGAYHNTGEGLRVFTCAGCRSARIEETQ